MLNIDIGFFDDSKSLLLIEQQIMDNEKEKYLVIKQKFSFVLDQCPYLEDQSLCL